MGVGRKKQGEGTNLSELELIARIGRAAATLNRVVRLGIGDDCAALRVPAGQEMLVTTDFSLEGVHFRRDWHTPESAGHRCLARGLSDVAAMGGRPVAAFLSLALPAGYALPWVDGFMAGMRSLAELHGVELAGGDTAEAPGREILADIVVIGAVARGKALRRATARGGDLIYVTGRLGGAALELERLAAGEGCPRKAGLPGEHPQTFPEPRVAVGRALVWRGIATSCMDLSDGISSDLKRICEASGVGAEVREERLPLSVGATLEQALHGGEDYELLFTARAETRVPRKIGGVPVCCIGRIVGAETHVNLIRIDGRCEVLEPGGWEHFRG